MQLWKEVLLLIFCFNHFIPSANCQAQACSSFVEYSSDGSGSTLRIPPPYNSTVINITVEFTINTHIESADYGDITLVEDSDELLQRLLRNNVNDIEFKVRFPIMFPRPYLTKLLVNDETLCPNEKAQDPPIRFTKLKLHYYWVSNIPVTLAYQRHQPKSIFPAPPVPLPPSSSIKTTLAPSTCPPPPKCYCPIPVEPETVQSERNDDIKDSDSWKHNLYGESSSLTDLVLGGHPVRYGQYPWMAALYHTTSTGMIFKCGGTLVSAMHVLTAAHCVPNKRPEDVVVYLGRIEILNFQDYAIAPEIARISTHPDYKVSSVTDLAIITFKNRVTFRLNIRPIFLWSPQKYYRSNPRVVGWGTNEHGLVSLHLKEAEMLVLDNANCQRFPGAEYILTRNSFCAVAVRNTEGGSPCHGDSGGGLYIRAEQGRWYIRGIVSKGLLNNRRACDRSKPATFVDVARIEVAAWIKQEMLRDGIAPPPNY